MNIRFLIFSLLAYYSIYSQSSENINIMLMNCYEGSDMDDQKNDFSDYWAFYEQEKYLTTNFNIKKYNTDSVKQPKFLIKGIKYNKGFSTNGRWINRKMYPGEVIAFSVPNKENERKSRGYSIYIKGDIIETDNNKYPFFEEIRNYELRVASNDFNESIVKTNIKTFRSGGTGGGIYLYWIGDLNDDNRLDMLVGNSNHFAGIELVLFLSDKSDRQLFIKHKVGSCSSC